MKKPPIILIVLILGFLAGTFLERRRHNKFVRAIDAELDKCLDRISLTTNDLLDAIEWVESKGDADAVGEDGEIGAYQITKQYVDDVNRIIIDNRWRIATFSYKDRSDKVKSREMVKIYIEYWGGMYMDSWKLEKYARIHNGGPDGWKKESTLPYWEKVKARLNQETQPLFEVE